MAKKKITEVTEELIRDFLDERKLSLWACEFVKEGPDYFLRVYIDKEEGYVGTQECEEVSRFLSDKLDEQDLIEREYYLEVSSPGLERKLSKPSHFKSSIGELVKVQTEAEKFAGRLVKADEESIAIENEEGIFEINISEIKKAKTYLEW